VKKERFIAGIYNTCDYWCQRCAFTQRCRNFAMGEELEREASGEDISQDATNAAFWNRLAEQVREKTIFGPAEAVAEEADFDLDLTPDPAWEAQHEAQRQAVRNHPLVRLAHDYRQHAGTWLQTANDDLQAVAQGLLAAASSSFAEGDVEEEAREIGEMLEVIAWYHTLIPTKLGRAIQGLLEQADSHDGLSELLAESRRQDAHGTGKVVLIAIERSIAAWVRLREILPKREDELLDILALLSRLQRGIRLALPGAQNFQRPGFDVIPPDEADDQA
jgi:hypothetical protein